MLDSDIRSIKIYLIIIVNMLIITTSLLLHIVTEVPVPSGLGVVIFFIIICNCALSAVTSIADFMRRKK